MKQERHMPIPTGNAAMKRWMAGLTVLALGALSGAQDLDWRQLSPIPDTLGVAGAFAGTSGGALLVMGGANFPDGMPWDGGKKAWHDTIYVLTAPEGEWKTAGKLPRPLAYGVSIQMDEGVLCIGGSDANRCRAEVFLVSWNGTAPVVRTYPPLPVPLANACGARAGHKIYVSGGETEPGATRCSTGFYSLGLNEKEPFWRKLPSCPGGGRTLAVAAATRDRFLLMGGVALSDGPDGKPERHYLASAYGFDFKKQQWQALAGMPAPAAAAPTPAPILQDGQVLILGGDDGFLQDFEPLSDHPGFPGTVLAYDARANAWSTPGNVPAPRATLPAVQWNGMIVLPSGEVRPGVRSPEVWAADDLSWPGAAMGESRIPNSASRMDKEPLPGEREKPATEAGR